MLTTEKYEPKPSVQTISNAMDVGNPSNFIRVQELFQQTFTGLKEKLSSYSFSDLETEDTMRKVFKESNYILDPHGAVGYLGLQKFLATNPDYTGVFLETAHPVKFLETVENAIDLKLEIPDSIKALMNKEKKAFQIKDYKDLKSHLLS
jgi:threonine synthase